jgi:arylsulfatase A-like enzyme
MMLSRWLRLDVAASVFAGALGAGLADLALMLRGGNQDLRAADAVALAVGLYGAAGLLAGLALGWAAAVVAGALPDPRRAHPDWDRDAAAGVVAVACGALLAAVLVAAGQAAFIGAMHSKRLAVIATAGVTLMAVVPAALVALACRGPARLLVTPLPRLGRLGRVATLLLGLLLLAVAAGALALSRADWRVLDLEPFKAAALALLLGGAHWGFWHASGRAERLIGGYGILGVRAVLVLGVLAMLYAGARVPEGSGVYASIQDDSLGLRLLTRVARTASDGDGDGHSARFGGGDCDDRRPDTYPGAEEVAGDGVDQNCQGGDATAGAATAAAAGATAAAENQPPAPVVRRAGEAFSGNLLIVSIDALRADRLGVAGYTRRKGRSLTPNLDRLAQRGAYFRRVWSQAPNTPRSFPAFLTGRYPSDVAWAQRSLNYSPILPANETFFEQLARAGWKPIGIFSHFYFSAERALNQGFAEWSNDGAGTIAESNKDIASPRIVPRVIARLEKAAAAKERFALWTHLFEPHSSYMEHKQFPVSLRGVEGLEEKYDYEIAYVDQWVGNILATLEKTGLAGNTAVVVLADHGEAWGEHKFYFHGQDLTEEQLRVPLIIAVPGRKPVVVEDEAAVVDVSATLLDLVGLTPPAVFRGRSLLAAIDGKPLPPRPLFAELLPATAWPKHEVMMVDRGKKLTHKITERRWELHDLEADPRQQRDLSRDPRYKALLDELQPKLLGFEEGRR